MGLSNLSSASMGLRSLYTFSAAGHGPSSPSRYLCSSGPLCSVCVRLVQSGAYPAAYTARSIFTHSS